MRQSIPSPPNLQSRAVHSRNSDNTIAFADFLYPGRCSTCFYAKLQGVAELFFDYRDLSDKNKEKFNAFRRRIESGFAFDIQNIPQFLKSMEKHYGTSGALETLDAIMKDYENSPKLIPFYGHRCFFDGLDDMPIISFSCPFDSIIYGENFEDYLKREFCGEKRAFTVG